MAKVLATLQRVCRSRESDKVELPGSQLLQGRFIFRLGRPRPLGLLPRHSGASGRTRTVSSSLSSRQQLGPFEVARIRIAPTSSSAHSTRISIVRGSAPSHSVLSMAGPLMRRTRSGRGRRRKRSNSRASTEYARSRSKICAPRESSALSAAMRRMGDLPCADRSL